MSNIVAILGRQPELGLAELESLYGPEAIQCFSNSCALINAKREVDFSRLGGTMRLAKIIDTLPTASWPKIENYLNSSLLKKIPQISGKLQLGISVFDTKVGSRQIAKAAQKLKKNLRAKGQSVRLVPHSSQQLNSATVLYNKLLRKNGLELLIISDRRQTIIAQTTDIQDIDAYAARDQARPLRDAKIGMLPPKLAQIIINLAAGQQSVGDQILLDPFCGTGVILQEAKLIGFDVYGTDINPRMVEYTAKNLSWLTKQYQLSDQKIDSQLGDATKHIWEPTPNLIACECYLGQPFATLPPSDLLQKNIRQADQIISGFLKNLAPQIPSGFKMAIAVPVWRNKNQFIHLKTLDYLGQLGYTRREFKHVANKNLIYHRVNQVVGRELLVLEKK